MYMYAKIYLINNPPVILAGNTKMTKYNVAYSDISYFNKLIIDLYADY